MSFGSIEERKDGHTASHRQKSAGMCVDVRMCAMCKKATKSCRIGDKSKQARNMSYNVVSWSCLLQVVLVPATRPGQTFSPIQHQHTLQAWMLFIFKRPTTVDIDRKGGEGGEDRRQKRKEQESEEQEHQKNMICEKGGVERRCAKRKRPRQSNKLKGRCGHMARYTEHKKRMWMWDLVRKRIRTNENK